jgi:hypothetical protein
VPGLDDNEDHGDRGSAPQLLPDSPVYGVHSPNMAKAELETTSAEPRTPLSRDRVLRAAVELADREGAEGLSMRRLSAELGVVPMALYKHVANKDELLDGMIDVVVAEIDPPRRPSAGKAWPRDSA